MTENQLQRSRLVVRSLFFLLFLLAPVLNIFRFDLTTTNFIVFNQVLSFGMTAEWIKASDQWELAFRVLTYFILPLFLMVVSGIYIFYKWGRLYCGWLCPHFSVVEYVNDLMDRRVGRVTIWKKLNSAVIKKLSAVRYWIGSLL